MTSFDAYPHFAPSPSPSPRKRGEGRFGGRPGVQSHPDLARWHRTLGTRTLGTRTLAPCTLDTLAPAVPRHTREDSEGVQAFSRIPTSHVGTAPLALAPWALARWHRAPWTPWHRLSRNIQGKIRRASRRSVASRPRTLAPHPWHSHPGHSHAGTVHPGHLGTGCPATYKGRIRRASRRSVASRPRTWHRTLGTRTLGTRTLAPCTLDTLAPAVPRHNKGRFGGRPGVPSEPIERENLQPVARSLQPAARERDRPGSRIAWTSPGPWTPRLRVCSMSAVRLGPVMQTKLEPLVTSSGRVAMSVGSSSTIVLTRTSAMCTGVRREARRGRPGPEVTTIEPVSERAASEPVSPTVAAASAATCSPRRGPAWSSSGSTNVMPACSRRYSQARHAKRLVAPREHVRVLPACRRCG